MESPRSSEKYPQKITQMIFFFFSVSLRGVKGCHWLRTSFVTSNWQILKSIGKNVGKKKKRIACIVSWWSLNHTALFVCFLKGKSALWQYLLKVKMSMCFDSAITVLKVLEE